MTKDEIIEFLKGKNDVELFERSLNIRNQEIGDKVYLRGLIELSNRCCKNCYYCGIRSGNNNLLRYELSSEQVLSSVEYALENNFGSIVIQSGEQRSEYFTEFIYNLLVDINSLTNGLLGITLSLGEQSDATYSNWYSAGANRYLLRIETSNRELYNKIHPENHSFDGRINCLHSLRKIGYQVGTGVMIGLPYQTIESMADDLMFLKKNDIDMCGMGPYIEHPDALFAKSEFTLDERFKLGLRMIALLRILMPTINIASTTALHALNPNGREMGIAVGANVIMPNITPQIFRKNYKLYDNKPLYDIDLATFNVAYGEWGDSKHFKNK